MERGNTTHGPRLDDEMRHETDSLTQGAPVEAHAEEVLLKEGSGEDEPQPTTFVGHRDDGRAPGLTPDQVEARSTIARWLHRADFPAVREQLIGAAIDAEAPGVVVDRLRDLPVGREFDSFGEVWQATGERPLPSS